MSLLECNFDNAKLKIRIELVELNKQNVATKAKKAEELSANLFVCNEAIKMMGDKIFDLEEESKTEVNSTKLIKMIG